MSAGALRELLAARGASADGDRLDAVTDVAAEHAALEAGETPLLVPLLDVAPLRLVGADRVDFLHGQISNDVRGLPVGGTNRALLLNHKGHALAAMTVCRRPDDLYLAVDGGRGGVVRDALARHIVFDQVEIEDLSGTLAVFTLQGASALATVEAALGAVPPEGGFAQPVLATPDGDAALLVHRARRSGPGGLDLHLLARDVRAVVAALEAAGARLAGEGALEASRVAAGLPRAEREAGEGVLPQEAGLEALLSYRKGCYLGQEIMARIEARGTLRRALALLRLDGRPEPGRDDVVSGGRTVGRIGTVVEHPERGVLALAVLRNDLPEGATLAAGGRPARREG